MLLGSSTYACLSVCVVGKSIYMCVSVCLSVCVVGRPTILVCVCLCTHECVYVCMCVWGAYIISYFYVCIMYSMCVGGGGGGGENCNSTIGYSSSILVIVGLTNA